MAVADPFTEGISIEHNEQRKEYKILKMSTDFGVIFDMDGVLVDSNPVHKKTLQSFFKKHDLEISEDFLRKKIYGRSNQEWIPDVYGNVSREKLNRLADDKEKMFRDNFDPKSAMVPGLKGFLARLHQENIKMAVATSAPKENADFILSELSIGHYFDAVLDSSYVTKGKPHPEMYLKAAEALGLPPQQCLVFEDSLAGVESGIRAGAKVIGITTTHTSEELKDCVMVAGNFAELNYNELIGIFNDSLL